jgi:uncharacterized protein (TIGR02145 family)
MKKLISLLVVILITTTQSQPIMRIWKNGVIIDSVAVTNDLQIIFRTGSGGFNCGTQIVYEGKIYNTVLIGNQCWFKENLNVGTMIQGTQMTSNDGIIEKYCYNNLESNCDVYGGLYRWNEAMQYTTTEGTQGICPPGWHIPTITEFQILRAFVGYNANALKAVGQGTGSGAGTNTSGFSALLAGVASSNGDFLHLGTTAFFWSSSEYDTAYAYDLNFTGDHSSMGLILWHKSQGYSIRCLKD